MRKTEDGGLEVAHMDSAPLRSQWEVRGHHYKHPVNHTHGRRDGATHTSRSLMTIELEPRFRCRDVLCDKCVRRGGMY